jgi:TetR/AcrR family fatty acid metabolism transcriptional regulator
MTGDKRERIMKAAVKVFARKGFYNSKVAEIAKKAGIADGTTYLYFKSKDDILISLFETQMEPIIARMHKELGKVEGAAEKLRTFAFLHLDMIERNQDLAKVLIVELRQSSKFMHEYPGTKFKEYLDVIAGIVNEGQQNGEIRNDVEPSVAKQAIFGALDDVATNWILSKARRHKLTDMAGQIADMFWHGLSSAGENQSRAKTS